MAAGMHLGLRTTVNLETRAYLNEFAGSDINSPGEPGVIYLMGAGFATPLAAAAATTLAGYRHQAIARNLGLVDRINPHLDMAAIDYERDVVPLTPGGCPTERHIVRAYVNRVRAIMPDTRAQIAFWSKILGKPESDIATILDTLPVLEEYIRARLAKKGGVGYIQPSPNTFPTADNFISWVGSCGAVPMYAWLDGASMGEQKPLDLLACLKSKGIAAVNIIPDRNWRFSDPKKHAEKTAKLREFVSTAAALDMPINIGTEMNKDGLPDIDDLSTAALSPYRQEFLRSAQIFVGHMSLSRYASFPYCGQDAKAEFGDNIRAKNRFFMEVGALPPLVSDVARRLDKTGPARALLAMRDSIQKQRWLI